MDDVKSFASPLEISENPDMQILEGQSGYNPPIYGKARKTTEALIRAGRRLLRVTPLEELKIKTICARARVTTGAFYGRFDSKPAYFSALQAIAIQEMDRYVAKVAGNRNAAVGTVAEEVHARVRATRRWILRNEGILRGSVGGPTHDNTGWAPFRQGGQVFAAFFMERLRMASDRADYDLDEDKVRFGVQMLLSTLVNSAINKPGPYFLHQSELDERLASAVCAYLRLR